MRKIKESDFRFTRTCERCDAVFFSAYPRSYCEDCRKKRDKERWQRWYRNPENKAYYLAKRKKK